MSIAVAGYALLHHSESGCIPSSNCPPIERRLALIRSARIAHLATSDKSGQPHVIPICFVCDGKVFYSPIDEKPKRTAPTKLKRLKNIRENPNVALVIDHYDEDWRKLGYILIFGKARIFQSGEKHRRAVQTVAPKISAVSIHGDPRTADDRDHAETDYQLGRSIGGSGKLIITTSCWLGRSLRSRLTDPPFEKGGLRGILWWCGGGFVARQRQSPAIVEPHRRKKSPLTPLFQRGVAEKHATS